MSETKLLPCPFCGSDYVIPGEMIGATEGMYRFRLSCGQCCCYMGNFKTEEEAIVAWNNRSNQMRKED